MRASIGKTTSDAQLTPFVEVVLHSQIVLAPNLAGLVQVSVVHWCKIWLLCLTQTRHAPIAPGPQLLHQELVVEPP